MRGLAENVRSQYTEMAKNLKTTPENIRYNIKQLEKHRVILGYKLLLDFNKLGLNWSLIHFSCNYSSELSDLIKKLKNDDKVIMISRSVTNDLFVDVLYNHVFDLKDFIKNYKAMFPIIYNSEIINIVSVCKLVSYLKWLISNALYNEVTLMNSFDVTTFEHITETLKSSSADILKYQMKKKKYQANYKRVFLC